jgi:hypothetical protein
MTATKVKPLKTIGETIIAYRKARPESSCEEITAFVKKHFPGCNTNPASVACTLGKASKKLNDPTLRPGRIERERDEVQLETFDINAAESEQSEETEEEAHERIMLRYKTMERLGPKVIQGRLASLIISGPPGLSKSWTIKKAIDESGRLRHDGMLDVGGGGPSVVDGMRTNGWYDWIGGGCSEVGLYRALWNMRKGGVLVFDDCDGVYRDEDSVNLLKIATDTTKERLVSWRKNATWLDDYGIDRTFDFQGSIIFLTNIDFERTILQEGKMTEHYKAFIDRAAYLCLTVRTARDFMIVLKEKAGGKNGFLHNPPYNLTDKEIKTMFDFIQEHQRDFYNLSLRLVGQLAQQMREDPEHWQSDARATKMKTLQLAE